jgi:hypothetical protein
MSHYMTALAMQQKGLKPATKIVLYWIADHHNSETGACFPSLAKLADECEMDRSTIIRHVDSLCTMGFIEKVERKRGNGSRTSNGYHLNLVKQPVANYDYPRRKMQPPPVAKCDPHNLGSYNLGKLTSKNTAISEELFEDLWSIYKKKVGKGQARKAYTAALRKVDHDKIHLALIDYVRSTQGDDKKYLPHLSTWLNGERWDDELQEKSLQDMTSEQQIHEILNSYPTERKLIQ